MNESKTIIKLIIDGCMIQRSSAQKRLFELYYGYVRAICNRYSSRMEDAEEMLNDSFHSVFKFIDRYDSEYPFKPWLRKVTVNCCLMHIRKYIKDKKIEIEEDIEVKYEDVQFELPEITEQDYMALLKGLSPGYRTVLNLYIIEGYKHHEIADILNISVGASKSNLSRAKKILQGKLQKDKRMLLKLKENSDG